VKGNKYFVVDTSGKRYSNKPLSKTRAEKQKTALHINTGHGLYGGKLSETWPMIEDHLNQLSAQVGFHSMSPEEQHKYLTDQFKTVLLEMIHLIDEKHEKKKLITRGTTHIRKILSGTFTPDVQQQELIQEGLSEVARQPVHEIIGAPGGDVPVFKKLHISEHPSVSGNKFNPADFRNYYQQSETNEPYPTEEDAVQLPPTTREQMLEQLVSINRRTGEYYDELMKNGYDGALTPAQVKERDRLQALNKSSGKGAGKFSEPDQHINTEHSLNGSGRWENEYYRLAQRVPHVDQRLLAEIGTDLKHRLAALGPTWYYSPLFKTFGIDTRKEALVKEAIETLTRLNKKSFAKIQKYNDGNKTWYYNPVTKESSLRPPIYTTDELVEESKVTGPLGKRVVRENPPKYAPITRLVPNSGVFDSKSSVVSKHALVETSPFPKGIKEIIVNGLFKVGDPVPWGKFNVVFIRMIGLPAGHSAVLIRHLNPFSYSFYDAHGVGWRDPTSAFYPHRAILDSIVGNYRVNFNDSQHQCNALLCRLFSKIRATYPNLSNTEYDRELKKSALEIANDPEFYVQSAPVPVYRVSDSPNVPDGIVGDHPPADMKEAIRNRVGDQPIVQPTRPGTFYQKSGDIWAAPLILQKAEMPLIQNPQEPVPYSTAAPLPVQARTLTLPHAPGQEGQTLASLASLGEEQDESLAFMQPPPPSLVFTQPPPSLAFTQPPPSLSLPRSPGGIGFGKYKNSESDQHILIGDYIHQKKIRGGLSSALFTQIVSDASKKIDNDSEKPETWIEHLRTMYDRILKYLDPVQKEKLPEIQAIIGQLMRQTERSIAEGFKEFSKKETFDLLKALLGLDQADQRVNALGVRAEAEAQASAKRRQAREEEQVAAEAQVAEAQAAAAQAAAVQPLGPNPFTYVESRPNRNPPVEFPPVPVKKPTGQGKLKFVKKYLKGQGIRATKKNIDKICNIMDVEGVVFE
jgi:hypothetical protein